MTVITDIYQPTNQSLHTLIFGKSGSGKTYMNKHLLMAAISDTKNFPLSHRFIVIDPKTQQGDYDIFADPIDGLNPQETAESLGKNRVTLVWPPYGYTADICDSIIEMLFDLSDEIRGFSATFILDEAGEVISHNSMPDSIGKLAVQGRSKNLKGVFLNQRPILNRKLDSQVETMYLFDMIEIDADNLMKRWGISHDKWFPKIRGKKHSFLGINFVENTEKMFAPIELIN